MKYTKCFMGVLALTLFMGVADARRVNMQVTVTAGTPVRLSSTRKFVNRLFIQSKTGNAGRLYIMLGVPVGTTCDATNAAHLTAELAPATATAPGGNFGDPQGANGNSPSDVEDLSLACIDGSNTSDVAVISFWDRN